MSKCVFFDIDGTIWDWENTIPESTVSAIRKLRANGHKAFLCSGRARGNIRSKKLFDVGFDGVIAACGNHVEMDGKILYEKILEPDLVKKILDVCKTYHMPIVLEGPKKHWLNEEGFEGDTYIDYLLEDLGEDAIFLNGYTDDIYVNKFSAVISSDTNFSAIKAKLDKEIELMLHDEVVVECVPKGTSKASGIAWLCEYLNIPIEDTYAIGDSVNDLEMFQFVGHSIAMGNGSKVAKDAAEYTTTSIYEDGIMNALKHYNLI